MMKQFLLPLTSIFSLLIFIGCNQQTADGQDEKGTKELKVSNSSRNQEIVMKKDGLTLRSVQNSPGFENASLKLTSPETGENISAKKVNFKFEVQNYKLGVQTSDAAQKLCSNSGKGQHIHFILDNEPYSAHYESEFEKEISAGHHVFLAFLSRSYHESIKSKDAYVLTEFTVGRGKHIDNFDPKAPHIFYSRPKGSYIGDSNIKQVLLDFYLVNADLSESGHKVRASINGIQFMITKWMPYFIEGLWEGNAIIALELLDANNQLVKSPFNAVKRVVTISKDEPLKSN